MARKRKTLGGENNFHIDAATHRLREGYKHAARITRATRRNDCEAVTRELMNTWGFIRQAEAHFGSLSRTAEMSPRGKQIGSNINGLKARWYDEWSTVGSQCIRKKRGSR